MPERKRKPTGYQKFYQSKDWKQIRTEVIYRDVLCQHCGEPYQRGARFQVDHIIAIEDGGGKFELGNLQLLCKTCHDRKSANEGHNRR